MTVDYTTVAVGAIAVVSVALIAAEVRKRVLDSRLAVCAKKVADSTCPRCPTLVDRGCHCGCRADKAAVFWGTWKIARS
jgi:hypothetical protein